MTDRFAPMFRRMTALFAVLLAFVLVARVTEGAERPPFRPGRILVIPKAAKVGQMADLHRQKGRWVAKSFPDFKNLEVVDLPAGQDVLATVKEYLDSGLVESAEPDYLLYKSVAPDDPFYVNGTQ